MKRRLKSWARTFTKLVLLILVYFWSGAAYKLVYAQTHDTSRLKPVVPLPYYQEEFIIDSLTHQTWVFGPAFRELIGELPPLGDMFQNNPLAVMANYLHGREQQLAGIPDRYPRSLFARTALEDASLFYGQWGSVLSAVGGTQEPKRAMAFRVRDSPRTQMGLPDMSGSRLLCRRLAEEYPESPQAPVALQRLAQMAEQERHTEEAQALYRRIALDYPKSEQASGAAESLYQSALAEGRLEQARTYKQQALRAVEQRVREQYPGRAMPASETITVLGFHIDLTSLELELQRIRESSTELAFAEVEMKRLRALRSLDPANQIGLQRQRERMEHSRSELWVANLFDQLKVGVPGPPPRPKEYTVSGRVEVDGKPLPNVTVALANSTEGGTNAGFQTFIGGGGSGFQYRGITDEKGGYKIQNVPVGNYGIVALYDLRPQVTGGAPIVPVGVPTEWDSVHIRDHATELPTYRFTRAVSTRTWGELPPQGADAVRLSWEPWAGAASYKVSVGPAPMFTQAFGSKLKDQPGNLFLQRLTLWESNAIPSTTADVPLLKLSPDQPVTAHTIQYEYTVVALDAAGRELARSASALSHFRLSPAARTALLKLHPPSVMPQRGRRRRGGFGKGKARELIAPAPNAPRREESAQ